MAHKSSPSKSRTASSHAASKTRTTGQPASAKSRTSAPAKTALARDLLKDLVALLKERSVNVTVKTGSDRYSILLVDGQSVAYIHAQNQNGIRVEPALAPADLPKGEARRLITPNGPKKTGRFLVSGVVPPDKLDLAAEVVLLAVAKREASARK
jgi:hypothetical protein